MLALRDDPATAYRRVEFDARIEGSNGTGLTRLCLERAISEIGQARSMTDRTLRGEALGRAGSALLALIDGVAQDNPLRRPLLSFYGGLRAQVLAAIAAPEQGRLEQVERDLSDVLALI